MIKINTKGNETVREGRKHGKEAAIKDQIVTQILGKHMHNEAKLAELRQMWTTQGGTIISATDVGLKDWVGTSSYALFLPQDNQPIVEGHVGRFQPQVGASSTWQELIGQLGVEVWLNKLKNQWGTPQWPIKIILIADSKTSMEIMENIKGVKGVKDALRAEMDVAQEINRHRTRNSWVTRQVVKVESHIAKSQVPNQFFWKCNKQADTLATKARDIFTARI